MAKKKKRPTRAVTKKPARAKTPKKAPAKPRRAPAKKKALAKKAAPAAKKAPARKAPARKKPATRKPAAPKASPEGNMALAKALRGHVFDILLSDDTGREGYEKAVDAALHNFREHLPSALHEAEGHVFLYYLDCKGSHAPGDAGYVEIASPKDVWNHIGFGPDATVQRRDKDGKIYVSLECSCDWEEEHGLQLVLEEGKRVVKVGPFNGHLTNADAYDDPGLEGVVYKAH
jgi:outer membrane biosynthesis protein TonB